MRVESPKNGHHNGNGAHEPPQPTPETLQAMVDHLEEQIALAPAPVAMNVCADGPPVAAPEAEPELDEISALAFISAQQLHAEELLDLQSQEAGRQREILKIAETFALAPATPLLSAAGDAVHPPAPMHADCIALSRPIISMRPPVDKESAGPATPQPLLLAGPILPADLESLGAMHATSRARPKASGKPRVPTWLISVTVITVMILGVASVMQNHPPDRGATGPVSTAPVATPASDTAVTPPPAQHPLARFVEVTGLRVVADLQHRSQLQYIVVNHSATELSGLALQITVRSSSAPGNDQAPLFRVSAVVSSLGPYQSKEIRTDIDSQLQSKPVPDWDSLRVDVQVTEP